MFDGGQAHLELVESDDPLEAGLEIMAQPPGKRLSALTLLSGGEQALTAIALIFALFLTNPAPICVLDEVDAPLDDANVERFCDLLDRMTARDRHALSDRHPQCRDHEPHAPALRGHHDRKGRQPAGVGRPGRGGDAISGGVSVRFIPPYPPRQPQPVASWRGFFGERARTSVYGWSEFAFETNHLKRNILGFTVHVVLDPDHVQHVLLDNAANYAKPDIVKTLLDPIIGKGLLTSDAALWREQRRIVAASFSPAAVEAQRGTFVAGGALGDGGLGGRRAPRHGGRGDAHDDDDHRLGPVRRRPAADLRRLDAPDHRRHRRLLGSADAGAAAPAAISRHPQGQGREARTGSFAQDT